MPGSSARIFQETIHQQLHCGEHFYILALVHIILFHFIAMYGPNNGAGSSSSMGGGGDRDRGGPPKERHMTVSFLPIS